MRDIRADLKDRADSLREQMQAAQAQFDKHMGQIKQDHDSRLKELRADLDAVHALMGAEQRRLGSTPPAPKAPPQDAAPQQLQPPQPLQPSQQPQPHQTRPRTPLAQMMGLQRAS